MEARAAGVSGGPRGGGRAAALAVLLALALASPARASDDMGLSVGPVEVVGGAVCVSWTVENPFTPKLLQTLEQGMPARVMYEVGVWKDRTFWFDKLVFAIRSQQKIAYDPSDRRYRIRSDTGPPRESSVASLDSLEARLFRQTRLPLVLASDLDPTSTYYVSVRVTVRPLSPEDLQEVEGWLAGGRSGSGRGGLPDYLIALAGSLSGLGDRTSIEKSERWKPADLAGADATPASSP
jgi:hypothetical protein